MGNDSGSIKGRPRKKELLELGYESDSEGNNCDSDDQDEDDTLITRSLDKVNAKKEEGEDEEEDMFASEDEALENQSDTDSKLRGFDMERFEREQGLEEYDLEQNLKISEKLKAGDEDGSSTERLNDYHKLRESTDRLSTMPTIDGVRMEAFNLREEVETGSFDKDMNYIKRKNSDDENEEDSWLKGIDIAEIKKARKAQKKRDENNARRLEHLGSTEELLENLIRLVEPAETPMEALVRLNPKKSKKSEKIEDSQKRKQIVFSITENCETLKNGKGLYEVYDMSREELMRFYQSQAGKEFWPRGTKRDRDELESDNATHNTKESNEDQLDNEYGEKLWEYRWLDSKDEIMGLYSTYEMKYWKETYFNDAVEVRLSGENEFRPIREVEFEA